MVPAALLALVERGAECSRLVQQHWRLRLRSICKQTGLAVHLLSFVLSVSVSLSLFLFHRPGDAASVCVCAGIHPSVPVTLGGWLSTCGLFDVATHWQQRAVCPLHAPPHVERPKRRASATGRPRHPSRCMSACATGAAGFSLFQLCHSHNSHCGAAVRVHCTQALMQTSTLRCCCMSACLHALLMLRAPFRLCTSGYGRATRFLSFPGGWHSTVRAPTLREHLPAAQHRVDICLSLTSSARCTAVLSSVRCVFVMCVFGFRG